MIEPALSDEALLADVRSAEAAPGLLHVWWLGQSGFLVQQDGFHLLFDPYLSDSLTAKYAGTEKPHVRMTRRVVSPDRLDFVRHLTSTHSHTDHLDAATLRPIAGAARGGVELFLPEGTLPLARERLAELDALELHPLEAGADAALPGRRRIAAIAAAHPELSKDAEGRHLYLGYVVRFGPFTVYHSGDTVVYPGMVEALRPFKVDLAILPINGKVGNMNGADAARLAKEIGAGVVVPCHYEMFEFNTADPRERFVPECQRLGQPYKALRAGERLTLRAGREREEPRS